jgi:hypothetical protein
LIKGTNGYALSLAAPAGWHFWNGAAAGDWSAAASWSNGAPMALGRRHTSAMLRYRQR